MKTTPTIHELSIDRRIVPNFRYVRLRSRDWGGGGDFPSRPPVCFFVVSREGAGCVLGCAACLFARRIYLHEGMQGWTSRSANRPQGGGG
jgi:hypothetical protein